MPFPLNLDLSARVAPFIRTDMSDVARLKRFLSQEGFYDFGDGMVSRPEPALLVALKTFQHAVGVPKTGEIAPGDETHQAIRDWLDPVAHVQREEAKRKAITPPIAFREADKHADKFIWRTKSDNKVRSRHAKRDGKMYSWDNPPEGGHPGEDYNCRCQAIDPSTGKVITKEEAQKTSNSSRISSSFKNEIAARESDGSGNYTARNTGNGGALGRYQMTKIARQDVGLQDSNGNWTGKYGVHSAEEFLANPQAQERAF